MIATARFEPILILGSLVAVVACDQGTTQLPAQETGAHACPADVIDDLEDGEGFICQTAGRLGEWYTVGDGTSSELTPRPGAPFMPAAIPEGRGTSRYAARLQGSGFGLWGGLMGFYFSEAAARHTYDASAADGIKFWMKSTVPVSVDFTIPSTIPNDQRPGTCADGSGEVNCYNSFHFAVGESPSQWTEYEVPFSALRQSLAFDEAGNLRHGSATFDPSLVVAVQFAAPPPEFDVWVDDIRLYDCGAGDCIPTCTDPEFPVACPASGGLPADCWPVATDCASPPELLDGNSVWGSGSDDVWVVGNSNTSGTGAIRHWDGSRWSVKSAGTDTPAIWGTWGSSENDVWAVADLGAILRWDGSVWSPTASNTTSALKNGVWGNGPNDVWVGGVAGKLLHWDGSAWSSLPSGSSQDIWGLWSSGANDVWAVGAQGAIVHWDGAAWSAVTSGTTLQLDGVWGSAASDVWAVGQGGTILHWNGSAWSPVPSGTMAYLDGVWGIAANDVWAVGGGGTILHWDGSAWSAVASGTKQYLAGVWGSAANDVWAVGYRGTVLHWDGSVWSASPSPSQ